MAYIYLPDGRRLELAGSRDDVAASVNRARADHLGLVEFTIRDPAGEAGSGAKVLLDAHQVVAVTEQPFPNRE
jgi:hypothetical protein